MTEIAVVGAGRMGTAMTMPLADNGHGVRLVGTHLDDEIIRACLERRYHPGLCRNIPDGVRPYYYEQLEEALDGIEFIISGVNSLGVHWIGRTLASYVRPGTKILALTKGVEAGPDGELHILPDVLAGELRPDVRDRVSIAAVGGAVLAGELAGRRRSAAVLCSHDEVALHQWRTLLHNDYYHVWLCTDVIGVELLAAIKNAYVVGIGSAHGMLERTGGIDEVGAALNNYAGAIFGAAASEMMRIVAMMGGRADLVGNLSGAGDLYITQTGGRTYRLGRLLGKGLTYSQAQAELHEPTLEGAFVIQQLAKAMPGWRTHGLVSHDDLPLLRALCRAITEDLPLEIPWDDLYGCGRVMM